MSAELRSRRMVATVGRGAPQRLLVALAVCPWRELAVCRTGRSVQMSTPALLVVLADLFGVDASIRVVATIAAASGVIVAGRMDETHRRSGPQLMATHGSA